MPAAVAGPRGGVLQLIRHGVVRPHGGRGAVPRTPVSVRLAQHVGDRAVRGLPASERRALVDGATQQGVEERQPVAVDPHDPRELRRLERRRLHAEDLRGADDHRGVAGRLGGRDEQQPLRGLGQLRHAAAERVLERHPGADFGRHDLPAVELLRGEGAGERDQRSRVAARLLPRERPHLGCGRDVRAVEQQGVAGDAAEPVERQLLDSGGLRRGQQQHDALGAEAPGDEAQRVRRLLIEPLQVVDEHEQRSRAGVLAEQGERREADQEAIGAVARPQPERRLHGRDLYLGQDLELREDRSQQLLEAGEGQRRLRRRARRAQQPEAVRPLGRVVEQGRLAGAGLPRIARQALSDPRAAARTPSTASHSRDRPWSTTSGS